MNTYIMVSEYLSCILLGWFQTSWLMSKLLGEFQTLCQFGGDSIPFLFGQQKGWVTGMAVFCLIKSIY